MRRTLLAGVVALSTVRDASAATRVTQCTAPEYRQLDFWLGDWDAYDADNLKDVAARVRVETMLGGCAVRESYEGIDGLVGESFSTYDASRKLWHQTWVTNRGQLLTIEGRFEGGRLTLQGPQRFADGGDAIVRAVWMPDADGARETAHTSTDGGVTWRLLFDMVFRRHGR